MSKRIFASLVLALAVTGCLGQEPSPQGQDQGVQEVDAEQALLQKNAEAEAEAGLVYTLEVEEGHAIKFFVPQDGAPFVSEELRIDQEPLLGSLGGATAVDIFKLVRPNDAVPAELASLEGLQVIASDDAAEAEADALSAEQVDEEPSFEVIEKHATSSGSHFETYHKYCPTQLASINASSRVCWLNRTGNGATDAAGTHAQGFLAAYNGNSILTYRVNGAEILSITVPQGSVRWIVGMSGLYRNCGLFNCDPWRVALKSHRFEINGGAGFHFGAARINYPWLTIYAYARTVD